MHSTVTRLMVGGFLAPETVAPGERVVDLAVVADLADQRVALLPDEEQTEPTRVTRRVRRHLVHGDDEVVHPRLGHAGSLGMEAHEPAQHRERLDLEHQL